MDSGFVLDYSATAGAKKERNRPIKSAADVSSSRERFCFNIKHFMSTILVMQFFHCSDNGDLIDCYELCGSIVVSFGKFHSAV